MLAPALAEVLRAQRTSFNARFAAARRRWSQLDPDDFSLFLRDQLSPVIAAVAASSAESAPAVAQVGYDLGLELVAEKLAGPSARDTALNTLWTSTLPSLARLIANTPRPLLASLTNATHHLASVPGTQLTLWHRQLRELGPRCANSTELLPLAQLLAWRCGLAHYRSSALRNATTLPPSLALAALDAPPGAAWPDIQAALLADPWYRPDSTTAARAASPQTAASAFHRVGAFRGFGGLFLTPPIITRAGDDLVVLSGDEGWLLIADAFGATFHRASPAELAAIPEKARAPTPRAHTGILPSGHTITSHVLTGGTLALTSAQSHSVWIGPAGASA
jgi:hypothetical protein